MTFRPRSVLLLATAVCLLTVPSSALAVEEEGRGENIKHVKNVPFADFHNEEQLNFGTDIEFATITLPAAKAKAAKKVKRKKCRKGKRGAACRRAQRLAERRARARAKVAPPQTRTFAFAGSYGDGLQIFDITNPNDVQRVAAWDCGVSQGDVQVFQRKDLGGRWFATLAHDDGYDFFADSKCVKDLEARGAPPEVAGGGPGTWIVEITNPYAPQTVSFIPFAQGSHNQTVHPSGKYLYNSNSDLFTSSIAAAVEIADITDPSNPKQAGEIPLETWPGLGTESHDLTFSADGKRAYVAAVSHGEILDTTDPAKPVFISRILDPVINVWHQTEAITIDGRDFLIAEDEFAGATGTGQCPNGGVHVYDITDERNPLKVGAWNIDDIGLTEDGVGTCTAHVFQLHPKEKLMTIAYYNGGVRVVDLTTVAGVSLGENGTGMKQVGWFRFPDSNAWAVKAPSADRKGFYLYANDHRRGLDVYQWTPGSSAKVDPGRWFTPDELVASAALLDRGAPVRRPLCLVRA